MANSVIILDEAQMMPLDYLKPCLQMLCELVLNYHSTVVFCSATQPAITNYLPIDTKPVEICENYLELYTFEELVANLSAQKQVLCIVNSRRHARELFSEIDSACSFHLSTLMCPVHRRKTLAKIKALLLDNQECRVVSTQLIEAGVDIDFPTLYRAMAGLDSIVQAAGRCNREGKLATGNVYLFEPDGKYTAHSPASLKQPIAITKSILRNYSDITSPQAITKFFEELYRNRVEFLDARGIVKSFENGAEDLSFPFREVADKFSIIESNTKSVIIPYDACAKKSFKTFALPTVTKIYSAVCRAMSLTFMNMSLKRYLAVANLRRFKMIFLL